MVGSGEKSNAHMHIYHNPHSNWSYTDALINDLFDVYREYSREEFEVTDVPFGIATDNILSDPCFGMPAAGMIMHPSLSYHSSMDTPELIEPDVARRNGIIAGAYLLYLADAGTSEAAEMSGLLDKWLERELINAGNKTETQKYLLKNAYSRAQLSLESFLTADGGKLKNAVPRRLVKGALTFDKFPDSAELKYQPAWNTKLNDPLFWADGKRTIEQIAVLSAAETGETDTGKYLAEISEFFEFLRERGYISLTAPR
jgi:hypothetical protein